MITDEGVRYLTEYRDEDGEARLSVTPDRWKVTIEHVSRLYRTVDVTLRAIVDGKVVGKFGPFTLEIKDTLSFKGEYGMNMTYSSGRLETLTTTGGAE